MVEVWSHPRPHVLYLAKENLSAGVSDSFELLQQSLRLLDVVVADGGQPAQVAAVVVVQHGGDVSEPGGRALVVADVVRAPERGDHCVAIGGQHRLRGPQTGREKLAR